MPSGQFLMEDFYYAGGLPAVMRALGEHGLLHTDALTVNGKTIWENVQRRAELERGGDPPARQAAVKRDGGIAVLRGNLAPDGAVSSRRRRRRALMKHRGRAVVFENIEDYKARIDDPDARRRRELRAWC